MEEAHKKELIAAIQTQLQRVKELCEADDVPPEIKVHEIRKSFKRQSALLKLFPAELQPEVDKFRKPLRIIARRLTLGRESTVNLQLLDRLIAETGGLDESINYSLKEKLTQTNDESLDELITKEKVLDDILRLMNNGRETLLPLLISSDYSVFVFDELRATFQKSKDWYRFIASGYDTELYHNLRKQLKTLWYQSELEAPGQTEVPGTVLEKLHYITDQLGDDHDWYIFIKEISRETYALSIGDIRKMKQLVRDAQDLNLLSLNQNLADFFRLSGEEYIELLRRL
ncbi:MAG: CHAD domain-containing protein [Draconibacterium sp.]